MLLDEDAKETFLHNNNDFKFFKGKQYIMSFDTFFKNHNLSSKTASKEPCQPIVVNIDNTASNVSGGLGGSGGIRDIRNGNYIQTDPNQYNYTTYNTSTSSSYTLYFNSEDIDSNQPTSYGNQVSNSTIQYNIQTTTSGVQSMQTSVNTSLAASRYVVGTTITTTQPMSPGGVGSTIIVKYYNDNTYSIEVIYFRDSSTIQLKQLFSASSEDFNCLDVELEGEIGVLTISAAAEVITQCLGTNNLNDAQRDFVLTDKRTINLANFLNQNNCSTDAKEFGLLAINTFLNNGSVDWDKNILFLPNWNDYPCQKQIVKDASRYT